MNSCSYRVFSLFAVSLLISVWPLPALTETAHYEESLDQQIYQLTSKSKKYIDADFIDSALISAYAADSLAGLRGCQPDTVTAAVYNNLGYCHYRNEATESALAYLDSALTTLRRCKSDEDSLLADIYVNFGRVNDLLSEYGTAIESYEKALSIQEVVLGPGHTEVGTTTNNLAIVKMYVGQYDEAEQLFNRTLDIWRAAFGPEHPDVGLCLINLGYLYDDLGRYEEAERCYHESLAIREKALGSDHSSIGFIRVNIASLQAVLGKDDLALDNLKKAREIIGNALGKRSVYYAQVLSSLASALINKHGDYAAGESLVKEALSICAERLGPDHMFAASLYTSLADYNSLFGKREAALDYYLMASEIVQKVYGRNSIDYAFAVASIAFASSQLIGHSDSPALSIDSLYEQYRNIIAECGTSKVNVYANSVRSFAGAMFNAGRYEESARLMKAYLADKEEPERAVSVHGEIALLTWMMGNKSEALAQAEEFAALVAGADHLTWYSLSYCHLILSEIYLFAGYPDEALEHVKKAGHYQELFLKNAFSNASQATRIALINHSAFMSLLPTRLNEINTREALATALKHSMLEKSYVIDAVSYEHEFIQCSDDPELKSICNTFSDLSARTASLVRASLGDHDMESSQDLISSLIRERDSLETVISNICVDYNPRPGAEEFEVDDISEHLTDDEVLIEYIRFLSTDSLVPETILRARRQFNYGAFILDSNGEVAFYDLGRAGIIDSLIACCRRHINSTGTKALTVFGPVIEQQLLEISTDLYHKVIGPFAHVLTGKKHLIVAPSRNICLIPFDILPTGDERYLVEDYRVSYVSSGMNLLSEIDFASEAEGPVVVFADPDYDLQLDVESPNHTMPDSASEGPFTLGDTRGTDDCSLAGFERLPHTVEEMKSIQEIVTQHSGRQLFIYSGDRAREKTVRSLDAKPSALHFATHGFMCIPDYAGFAERYISPLFQSGLALAGANNKPGPTPTESSLSTEDGILSAYEVSALNLQGTDLVVLSACESGVGEYINGMGVMGLPSSFRQAGAKSVIMSLWKVPDDMSARLMKGFYARWLKGEAKITALRETSLELLNEARTRYGNGHPIHWAGFILAGKPH